MTTSLGYALSSEEHAPADLVRHARLAEEHGFTFALISRPLPPVDRSPGPQPVRVGRARGDRAGHRTPDDRDRRDLSDDPDPSGDHRPGGRDGCRPDARPILPRGGHGREPERARARWPLAGVGGPGRDARRGAVRDPRALEGRGDEPPRPPLHRRERPDLHAPRRAAADPCRGRRTSHGHARRTSRGRPHRHWPGGRLDPGLSERGRAGTDVRAGDRVVGVLREGGSSRRTLSGGRTPRSGARRPRSFRIRPISNSSPRW